MMKLVKILVVEIPSVRQFNEKYGTEIEDTEELEDHLYDEWTEEELTAEFGSLTKIFKLID